MKRGEVRDKADLDRELIELLNELRVALPGVQVLFAFLLIVPFSNGWHRVTEVQRYVYFVAFLCAAAASAFLIAPSAYHRLRWRDDDKEHLLTTGNRLAIVGIGFLAAGMTATVFLISDVLFGNEWGAGTTAVAAGCFVWLWFGLPLWGDARKDRRERGEVDVPARNDADDLPPPGSA